MSSIDSTNLEGAVMTRWTWLLVGGLAVAAVPQEVAAAGYRKVKGCSHGEPVFVPRSCQREFARTTRELHLGLETEIAGVVQAMELSSSAEDLNVRLDQINSELQSHYVGICQTTSRDPCDRERLAELDEEMGHLRTLYADLRRVVSTSGEGDEWLLGELEQIQVAIRESDDLEDVLVTRRNPTVRLTGTWSVTSTPIPGACPPDVTGPVQSIWRIVALSDEALEVRVVDVQGQMASGYSHFSGDIEDGRVRLTGEANSGKGARSSVDLRVDGDQLIGIRKVETPDCVFEYEVRAMP